MPKTKSRPQRWRDAVTAAETKIGDVKDLIEGLLGELRDIQSEYEEWLDGLPENLQQSTLGEKLQAVVDIDLEDCTDIEELETKINEAEGADLPLGFGRD